MKESAVQRVLKEIRQGRLMQAGESVLAGVSGGADSVCLLSALAELKEELGIRLGAVHVNHGIRGAEADRDEAFVKKLCGELGVSCLVYKKDVPALARERGLSLEEAGRLARRQCFEEALKETKSQVVAVAHNRNDNAETVLFRLFRGSGLIGLSGMKAETLLPGGGRLIRPLLSVSRGEIEACLAEKGLSFCRDSTNGDASYSRNRIRMEILPRAELVNSGAVDHIVQAAAMIGELSEAALVQAEEWIRRFCLREPEDVRIPCGPFMELSEAAGAMVLRVLLEEVSGAFKDLSRIHIRSLLRLAASQSGRRLLLPGGIRAFREGADLVLSGRAGKEADKEEEAEVILQPGEEEKEAELFGARFSYRVFRAFSGQKIPENPYTKWFDYDKINNKLSLRGRRPGDWLCAYGDGRRQTVKAYMINEKIPAADRGRIPLLADGSHILWVAGGRVSEAFKVSGDTERILEVKFKRGENGYGR